MNLLEHYILEIYAIRKIKADREWLSVEMLISCYGAKQRVTHTFFDELDFEKAINDGYFMA